MCYCQLINHFPIISQSHGSVVFCFVLLILFAWLRMCALFNHSLRSQRQRMFARIHEPFSVKFNLLPFDVAILQWNLTKWHYIYASKQAQYVIWRENHRYCRTTLNIMPLGRLSAIQCNWLKWSNWDRTADLTLPCVCSATKMLNIKHPYQLHPFQMTGYCPESNQLHFIIP